MRKEDSKEEATVKASRKMHNGPDALIAIRELARGSRWHQRGAIFHHGVSCTTWQKNAASLPSALEQALLISKMPTSQAQVACLVTQHVDRPYRVVGYSHTYYSIASMFFTAEYRAITPWLVPITQMCLWWLQHTERNIGGITSEAGLCKVSRYGVLQLYRRKSQLNGALRLRSPSHDMTRRCPVTRLSSPAWHHMPRNSKPPFTKSLHTRHSHAILIEGNRVTDFVGLRMSFSLHVPLLVSSIINVVTINKSSREVQEFSTITIARFSSFANKMTSKTMVLRIASPAPHDMCPPSLLVPHPPRKVKRAA